jgi:CheY-like chemotaxis protein
MEPMTLAAAAGAYVAASIAKKSADAAIAKAYERVCGYAAAVFKWATSGGDVVMSTTPTASDSDEPALVEFGREVLARSPALRRAALVSQVVEGARILWADDAPDNNRDECQMLAALGAMVRQVRSTDEALGELHGTWDLVLSDVDRDGIADAGLQMLGRLPPGAPPVVFYVGRVDGSKPVPRGAFGIADRPETLLHLVLDVLERRRV